MLKRYKFGYLGDFGMGIRTVRTKLWMSTAVLAGLILYGLETTAETLTAGDIYRRCYIRMVRLVPNEADPLLLAAEAGTKSGDAACLELFDRAKLTTAGVLANRSDLEAHKILRTFHDLHMSWFQSKNHGFIAATDVVRDLEEPALYYLRAAFLPSTPFRSVVTLNQGLAGVRDQKSYPAEKGAFISQRVARHPADFPYTASTLFTSVYRETPIRSNGTFGPFVNKVVVIPDANIVEVGDIAGVKASVAIPMPGFRFVASNEAEISNSVKSGMATFNGNAHFGGGIVGSQSFVMTNMNLSAGQVPKDYDLINRRLTARVYEDLLCHVLPTLTDADVASEVLSTSPHTFQQGVSCMRCHSSIDGLAFGYRNLVAYVSAANPDKETQNFGLNYSGIGMLPQLPGATTFALKAPSGRLHYRELVTGNRRDDTFTGLAALGNLLGNSNDLYTCAAKRYYRFFTGVDVDLTKPASAPLDKIHQDKVLDLGAKFKTHQSVRTLLQQIFQSDAFKASDYNTEKTI